MQMKLLTPDDKNGKNKNSQKPKPQTTRKEQTDAALKNYCHKTSWDSATHCLTCIA